MENKDLRIWLGHKYPCTITRDRYEGVYSGAPFIAFPLLPNQVPQEWDDDDVTAARFWDNYNEPVGRGITPEKAYWDLVQRVVQKIKEKPTGKPNYLCISKLWPKRGIYPNWNTTYTIAWDDDENFATLWDENEPHTGWDEPYGERGLIKHTSLHEYIEQHYKHHIFGAHLVDETEYSWRFEFYELNQ